MSFTKGPAPISPMPSYPGVAGGGINNNGSVGSPLSSPDGGAATTATSSCCTSTTYNGYYGNNNNSNSAATSPQSPYYSVASSTLSPSSSINNSPPYNQQHNQHQQHYYYVDSPYSVQSANTTATNRTGMSSSTYNSAYAGDNETVGSSKAATKSPIAKRAKQEDLNLDLKDRDEDRSFERTRQTPDNARALEMLEQTLSEDGSLARRRSAFLEQRKKDVKREKSSNLRALNLFDEATTGERHRTLSNDGRNEINYLKQEKDVARQNASKNRALHMLHHSVTERRRREDRLAGYAGRAGDDGDKDGDNSMKDANANNTPSAAAGAKCRALILLDQTISGEGDKYRKYNPINDQRGVSGGGLTARQQQQQQQQQAAAAAATAPFEYGNNIDKDENMKDAAGAGSAGLDDFKNSSGAVGAKCRALILLDQTTSKAGGGRRYRKYSPMDSQSKGDRGRTARQAAITEYEKRKREKMEVKAQVRTHREKHVRPPPRIQVPTRQEALAESSRRNYRHREKTAEDVRDPETVAGMKCQLDWDREKFAQAKALRMLNQGFFS